MTGKDQLVRQVRAGELIIPWLILGPCYEDLSDQVEGLTLFERAGAMVGRTAMAEVIEEARQILTTRPREGTRRNSAARRRAGAWCAGRRSISRGATIISLITSGRRSSRRS